MGLKQERTTLFVSPEGEVLDQIINRNDIRWEYAETFVGIYPSGMAWRHEIKGAAALTLFLDLADLLPFESNVVSIGTTKKKEIIKDVGGEATFYKALKMLEAKRAVISLGWKDPKTGRIHRSRGEYMLNPTMVWRGKSAEREKEIERFQQRIKQGY